MEQNRFKLFVVYSFRFVSKNTSTNSKTILFPSTFFYLTDKKTKVKDEKNLGVKYKTILLYTKHHL